MSGGREEGWEFEGGNALRANLETFADAIEGRAGYPIATAQIVDVFPGPRTIVEAVQTRKAVSVAEG